MNIARCVRCPTIRYLTPASSYPVTYAIEAMTGVIGHPATGPPLPSCQGRMHGLSVAFTYLAQLFGTGRSEAPSEGIP